MDALRKYFQDMDCGCRCRSEEHRLELLNAVPLEDESLAKLFCAAICRNFYGQRFVSGQHLGHQAAGAGRADLLDWLLGIMHLDGSLRDRESFYTPMHMALLYGQITCAQVLLDYELGAAKQLDREGLLPIDILARDKIQYVVPEFPREQGQYSLADPSEVYSYGDNMSYNLGHAQHTSLKQAEAVELFRQRNVSVKAVWPFPLHTVFLSSNGEVYLCGLGFGGRLGHDDEQIYLQPKHLQMPAPVAMVTGGYEHSVFVLENGQSFSCGINTHRVLGLSPWQEKQLTPKQIFCTGKFSPSWLGCAAGRYHTVLYTSTTLYSVGLNAGQMGLPKLDGQTSYVERPHVVTVLAAKEKPRSPSDSEPTIVSVKCTVGATVVVFSSGNVYALTNYGIKKVANKLIGLVSVDAMGGYLDHENPIVRKLESLHQDELRIVLLSRSGAVQIWSSGQQVLTRVLFEGQGRTIYPTSVAVMATGFFAVDAYGAAYRANLTKKRLESRSGRSPGKQADASATSSDLESPTSPKEPSPQIATSASSKNAPSAPPPMIARVSRLSNVHRGLSIACTTDGANVFVLQNHPANLITDLPQVSQSVMVEDFRKLGSGDESLDFEPIEDLADVKLIVKNSQGQSRVFPCHKYILASRVPRLASLLEAGGAEYNLVFPAPHDTFADFLRWVYTDNCRACTPGGKSPSSVTRAAGLSASRQNIKVHDKKQQKKKSAGQTANPVQLMADLARKLDVKTLVNRNADSEHFRIGRDRLENEPTLQDQLVRLDCLTYDDVTNSVIKLPSRSLPKPRLRFNRAAFPDLADVTFITPEEVPVQAHRVILWARVEYYQCMLSSDWAENMSSQQLSTHIPHDILGHILHYVYTDDLPALRQMEFEKVVFGGSPKFFEKVCSLLIHSDHLLLTRLREMCEVALSSLVTLRNAPSLLEFASAYNADMLHSTVMQFCCLNLAPLLESDELQVLSRENLDKLTAYYRNMFPSVRNRIPVAPKISLVTKERISATIAIFASLIGDEIDDETLGKVLFELNAEEQQLSASHFNVRKRRKMFQISKRSDLHRQPAEKGRSISDDVSNKVNGQELKTNVLSDKVRQVKDDRMTSGSNHRQFKSENFGFGVSGKPWGAKSEAAEPNVNAEAVSLRQIMHDQLRQSSPPKTGSAAKGQKPKSKTKFVPADLNELSTKKANPWRLPRQPPNGEQASPASPVFVQGPGWPVVAPAETMAWPKVGE